MYIVLATYKVNTCSCMHMFMHVCVCVCVRACVHACVLACQWSSVREYNAEQINNFT